MRFPSHSGRQIWLALLGILLLLGGAALAAFERSEAPASTVVAAGVVLIAASAFYERVRKIGPGGIELDPAVLDDVEERLPPPSDDSAAGERQALLDALRAAASTEPPETSAFLGGRGLSARVVEEYSRAQRLEEAARRWVVEQGWRILPSEADLPWHLDVIADKDESLLVLEARAGRPGDTARIASKLREVASLLADARSVRPANIECWLVVDIVPPAALLDPLRRSGIGVLKIDLTSGIFSVVLQPREQR